MSEVIRDFIKEHPQLGESDCFEEFLQQERIRAWVGTDPQRREKIRGEFHRIWVVEKDPGANTVQVQRTTVPTPPSEVRVHKDTAAMASGQGPAARPTLGSQVAPRKLNLLCASCDGTDVWAKGHLIECRRCGRIYDNMLDLVPVQPVGPFTYMFGEGAGGVATAVGLVLFLLVIYYLFRWP